MKLDDNTVFEIANNQCREFTLNDLREISGDKTRVLYDFPVGVMVKVKPFDFPTFTVYEFDETEHRFIIQYLQSDVDTTDSGHDLDLIPPDILTEIFYNIQECITDNEDSPRMVALVGESIVLELRY